jgi:enoyl-CoA hydratase
MAGISHRMTMTTALDQLTLVKVSFPTKGVAQIQLNRPEKRNALSGQLLGELAAALDLVEREAVACVVLTGDDKFFSAGADIAEMRERGFEAISNAARMQSWARIERFSLPIVAAVRGICFGGGHELAMLADVVIAADDARFGQPEIKLGILPGDGATQRLTHLVGKPLAMKMILSGEPIGADEALRAGLVAEVVANGSCLARALEIAAQIAGMSPFALRLAKDAVLATYETGLSEGLRTERRNIALAFSSADQKEGMAAFFEKRAPQFTGR